jgi:predicted RNA-binding protein YlxR (DUF448 family)
VRQTTEQHEPVRSCIGCRARHPQSALVRITRTESDVVVDGPSSGRGAWLCRNSSSDREKNEQRQVVGECLEAAITKRAFARAWRTDIGADDITNIRKHTGHL